MPRPRRRREVLRHPPLYAQESEYAVTFLDRDGNPLDRETCIGRAVRALAARHPHVCGRDRFDLYLPNGGRFYRDNGLGLCNLEYATPECSAPGELVVHIRAGDALAYDAVRAVLERCDAIALAVISKTNVDYHGHTNGSHENHLYAVHPARLAPQLEPLLAARSAVTGGGGFDDTSPGADFVLSPRAPHIEYAASRGAQHSRAIFTIKDEDLSGGRYRRLQLLSAEGVRCALSEQLRFGIVSLVIRVVESGGLPGQGLRLADPLAAIHAFARDPDLRVRVPLANGGEASALQILRHYLHAVEARADEPWMPDWAESLCTDWRAVLDGLEAEPRQLIGWLDWPTKRELFRAHAERRGVAWSTLPRFSAALRAALPACAPRLREALSRERTPDLHPLLATRGATRRRIGDALAAHGLDLRDLERFVGVRQELFELDLRFGELGPESLFAALERDGLVAPGSIDAAAIEHATSHPPPRLRGALRGAWVRQLHAERAHARYACHWDHIRHLESDHVVDLSDPFGQTIGMPSGTARAPAGACASMTRIAHQHTSHARSGSGR